MLQRGWTWTHHGDFMLHEMSLSQNWSRQEGGDWSALGPETNQNFMSD